MRRGWLTRVPRTVGFALLAVEIANILDGLSTWIAVVVHGGTEQGPGMAPFIKLLGAEKGIVVGKGIYGLLALGVALAATDAPWPQLRVPARSRLWVTACLWAAVLDWGYGAAHNFLLRR